MLNLIAPINTLSYGYVSLNFLKCLVKQNIDVAYFPIIPKNIEVTNEEDLELVKSVCADPLTFGQVKNFHPHSPTLRIWHQNCHTTRIGRGPLYGMSIFELDTFTDQEKFHMGNLNHVIVNSEWAKQIVLDQTIHCHDTVSVVPLGVDTDIFKPASRSEDDVCRFINIGKIEIRKGHDVLIKVFERAFKPDDNVILQMAWSNPFLEEKKIKEWEDYYRSSPMGHKVEFLPRVKTQKELANYIAGADCGVFISRGEGFNLPLLECMAMGKEVIATNYSAHTEFANDSNCRMVEIDDIEPAYDGFWFHGQGNWAKISDNQIKDVSNHMRFIYEAKRAGHLNENIWGIETGKEYSWTNSTNKLIQTLGLK